MSNLPADVEKYTADYNAKRASAQSATNRERPEVMVQKGARFFKTEKTGVTLFGFRSSANSDFVTVAKESHREAYPKEWLDFARTQKGKK